MATVAPDRLDSLPEAGEPDGLFEVVEGRFVDKSTCVDKCWFASVIFGAPGPYVQAARLGRVVAKMIFDLRPRVDRERRPDVAFVSFERWARDRRLSRARSWAVIPGLAVEIIGLTNSADEVAEKLEESFRAGVRQDWVVYPVRSQGLC